MSIDRKQRALALGALLLSALALGGCSISIADLPLAGTPADAPERPKEAGAYLPVNELPPDRDEPGSTGQDSKRTGCCAGPPVLRNRRQRPGQQLVHEFVLEVIAK